MAVEAASLGEPRGEPILIWVTESDLLVTVHSAVDGGGIRRLDGIFRREPLSMTENDSHRRASEEKRKCTMELK